MKTGLDVLEAENCKRLMGLRIGILAHPSSVTSRLEHVVSLFMRHGIKVVRLFGPEHGILGNIQYMADVEESIEPHSGLPVVSLYGKTYQSLHLHPTHLKDLDGLVIDLQDVGSRYYTFCYTMAFAMRACAQAGIKCWVLDRPNPIGAELVEGNEVEEAFRSFVGEYPIANRHGLTLGELALLFQKLDNYSLDLEVVWMEGYHRRQYYHDTGLPWILPSPNMPTPETALVYPGGCLLEGTNLSEGRGTTKPFELLGAPYISNPHHFADELSSYGLTGVLFRPCWFTPTWDKHQGNRCGGIQVHVTNRELFRPLITYTAIIWLAHQHEGFDWRREAYEFVSDRLAIDLLFGSKEPRLLIEQGATFQAITEQISAGAKKFIQLRSETLHANYAL